MVFWVVPIHGTLWLPQVKLELIDDFAIEPFALIESQAHSPVPLIVTNVTL